MEENHLFRREIKIDDYEETSPNNTITIIESSNPRYGSGSKVWESSIALAKAVLFMHQQGVYSLKGKTVIELGCGAGLLSIYLAALGAKVYATDLPMAKELIEMNIRNNTIVTKDRISFTPFNWNDEWPLKDVRADLIVASEPFVGPDSVKAFLKCASFLLKTGQPDCKLFLAFKLKDNDLTKFAQALEERGMHQQKWSLEDMHPDYADPRVGVYTIRLL